MSEHVQTHDAGGEADADPGELYGIMGYFETPAALYHACEEIRDAGYKHFDAHTPFPVHGLEKAMGLKPTKLPFLSLAGGITGLASAVALTWYVNYDYPLNISGKAPFSYQIYIPIYFELTVLLTAFATFFGLWALCKLPTFYHPTMKHPKAHRATTDLFFVTIESKDPKYDLGKTKKLLEKVGAKEVEEVFG